MKYPLLSSPSFSLPSFSLPPFSLASFSLPSFLPPPPFSLPTALPKPLTRFISVLPAWPASRSFAMAANLAAWPSLREMDWSSLYGRHFCVHVRDAGLKLYFSLQADGFHADTDHTHHTHHTSQTAEVTFTASSSDFARLALRLEDPDTLFFNRRLLIEGDTDLGLTVKNMLDAVELETATAHMPAGLGALVLKLRQWALNNPN